ncbi:plasmid partitioning protein RepB (plasmid) [Mesorhizobium sp. ORM8.1]
MARKDVFGSVMGAGAVAAEVRDVANYAVRGASRSIMQSFEELSKSSVVDLDPALIDSSFVSDRIDDADDEFLELLAAIRERGQDSPVLVRPHPSAPGRYQTVFGHRRLKVARHLGRPVRAVVKNMDDKDHVIAQGQENAARADLSFIERTLFAERILKAGHSPETVKLALALDDTTFSKMRSVTSHVPEGIILAVGAAKGIGRDRWWQLAKLMERHENGLRAADYVKSADFSSLQSDIRFTRLFDFLSSVPNRARAPAKSQDRAWTPGDKSVRAKITDTGKIFTLALKSKDASTFGAFIADRLDELFVAFRESEQAKKTGD